MALQHRSGSVGERTGTFTGQEKRPDFSQFGLTGSWEQGEVTFTVDRAVPVTYTGSIDTDNPIRLSLTSLARGLVIEPGQ